MRTIASVAISADGFIDDNTPERLILSTPEDWEAVYRLRAACDAILVGAETIRRDNPSLKGVPLKIILTRSGNIDPAARIFSSDGEVLILNSIDQLSTFNFQLSTLLVEGGAKTLKLFYDAGLVDVFRLAKNPKITVGEGVKLDVHPEGPYVSENLGGMEVRTYYLTDVALMGLAIEESKKSPPSPSNYRVGAVVVTADNRIFTGYTHETSPTHHAEQEAIKKALAAGADLHQAVMCTSMEPCTTRKSEPESCTALIVKHGFRRVIFALHEPSHLALCEGETLLREAEVEVAVMSQFADAVREINNHIR